MKANRKDPAARRHPLHVLKRRGRGSGLKRPKASPGPEAVVVRRLPNGGAGGAGRPLAVRREWKWLPHWIQLHAERGPLRKCWEGHRLVDETQDGRRFGECVNCCRLPRAGGPILACRACEWSVCMICAARPRLPRLADDPLFQGRGRPCLLGLASPPPAAVGTVIVCPGGNYEFLCPHEGMPVVSWLASRGIRAEVLRYRVLPTHGVEDALSDLAAAVAAARRRGGPVAAMGFSAGGHLVASFAIRQAEQRRRGLDAQVLVYPAIDPADWADDHKHGFWDWEACTPKAPAMLARAEALLGGPGFVAPPTFLVASTGDDVCPPREHSDRYAEALKKRRVPHAYVRKSMGSHGFGLGGAGGGWTKDCAAWLQAAGFGGHALGGA